MKTKEEIEENLEKAFSEIKNLENQINFLINENIINFKSFIKDTTISLQKRWDTYSKWHAKFIKWTNDIPALTETNTFYKILKNDKRADFLYDLNIKRGSEIDLCYIINDNYITALENYDFSIIIKEEILQKEISLFLYDW